MDRNPDISCCSGLPIDSVKEFLREMVALTGQDDGAENPVLELQIEDVVSRTTIEVADGTEYLVVVASLPASERSSFLPARSEDNDPGQERSQSASISWNADAGCYVATRRIRTRDLQDDRSVMNAILNTVDQALGWQDLLKKVCLR